MSLFGRHLTFVGERVGNGRGGGGDVVKRGWAVDGGRRSVHRGRAVNGGRVHRSGGRVHRSGGGVHRSGGGVHWGWSGIHRRGGGDDFAGLADLGHETVNVVGGVRHGPDGAVRFGQAVLSLDHAVGQALLGRLVVAGGRVGHAVLVRVRRVRRHDRLIDGGGVSGGVRGRVSGRVVLGLYGENGDANEANGYLEYGREQTEKKKSTHYINT